MQNNKVEKIDKNQVEKPLTSVENRFGLISKYLVERYEKITIKDTCNVNIYRFTIDNETTKPKEILDDLEEKFTEGYAFLYDDDEINDMIKLSILVDLN